MTTLAEGGFSGTVLTPGYALVVVGFGSPEQHAEVLDQIRTALPPTFDFHRNQNIRPN